MSGQPNEPPYGRPGGDRPPPGYGPPRGDSPVPRDTAPNDRPTPNDGPAGRDAPPFGYGPPPDPSRPGDHGRPRPDDAYPPEPTVQVRLPDYGQPPPPGRLPAGGGPPGAGTAPGPVAPQGRVRRPKRSRRKRFWIVLTVILVVLVGLLFGADRITLAYAENQAATQIQKQGFEQKPSVTIEGFPFLPQAIRRDFDHVRISSDNLTISGFTFVDLEVDLYGVHVDSSLKAGTIDKLDGTTRITFAQLTSAAGQQGVALTSTGGDGVQGTIDLGVTTVQVAGTITQVGNDLQVQLTSVDGVPASLLGSATNFSVTLPALPMGLTVQDISVTAAGVTLHVTGQHTNFGG